MKMFVEITLKNIITSGDEEDPVAQIHFPPTFNIQSVITTRETLWRIAGYGSTTVDRYLDDLVSKVFFSKRYNILESKLITVRIVQ